MMDLVKRTLDEFEREVATIPFHLKHWWNEMSAPEQLYFVGITCAVLLLLGLRRPARRKINSYQDGNTMGLVQQFLFAAAILVVFTFGIDIAFDAKQFSFTR